MTLTKYSTKRNAENKAMWRHAEKMMRYYPGLTLREVYFKIKLKEI